MIWPFKHTRSINNKDRSSEIEAMAEVITKLRSECESHCKRADRYWRQLQELKEKLAADSNLDLREVLNVIDGATANKTIDYIIEQDDTYFRIIANHPKGLTVSFNREFDTSKSNHNWVDEGMALITLRYDNVNHVYGCPTIIRSGVSGIFEYLNNKMIMNGEEICRVRIYSSTEKHSVIEDLERKAIKVKVLQRERK